MSSSRNYGPTGAPGSALAINTPGAAGAPLPAQLVANTVNEQVVLNPSFAAALAVALSVAIPANSQLEQRPFEVVASGYIAAGAIATVTAKLYSGNSSTPGNNTLLGSSGAINYAAIGKAPYWVRARGIYDSVSGKLTGTIQFFINGTLVAEAAFTNTVAGVNGQNNPVASFSLSFQFSVANAGNLVNVQEFAINF